MERVTRTATAATIGAAFGLVFFVVSPAPTQEEKVYVGSELCAECHPDQWDKIEGTAHAGVVAYLAAEPDGVGGCEACHGPGSLHVERAGIEAPGFRAAIDRSPDPGACSSCHVDQAAQFSLPERHPVNEGLMSCSDCHDPHDASDASFALAAMNDSCTDCHTDKAGPWVFPHPVQETEGCVACHQPHGSTNPHMLPFREVQFTCLSCHVGTPAFHSLPSFSECNGCHVQIHGSNLDRYFLK